MRGLFLAGIILFIMVILVGSAAFVVDETEQVVITQFGKPVGDPIKEAGLHFRIPFIQEANFFPKNLLQKEKRNRASFKRCPRGDGSALY